MNTSLTVTSDFNSSPLLFELDFNNYCKDRIHFNIILKTNNEFLKKMYLSYKDYWDSSDNKCDPYKDTGIPLYMPEAKLFKSKTITEVDFEIEMIFLVLPILLIFFFYIFLLIKTNFKINLL